jgi:hypothetical protein
VTRRVIICAALVVLLSSGMSGAAWADNCGSFADCFSGGRGILLALAGVLVIAGLAAITFGAAGLLAGMFGGGALAAAGGGVIASAGAISATAAATTAMAGTAAVASGVLLAEAAQSGGGGPGGQGPRYEPSPKHGTSQRGDVAPAPSNGQAALDRSVQIKPTTTRRVGVDAKSQEIVVFDETHPGQGIFHGHVRSWGELRPEMQNALRRAGLVDGRGRIVP